MFDVSDEELSGIEARAGVGPEPAPRERSTVAGAPYGFGDVAPVPGPPAPSPPPPLPPMPMVDSDAALRRGAGSALVLCTGGMVVGAIFGGALGAAAGVVGAGAVRNVLRVKKIWSSPDPDERSEAGKSATMAIFGLGIAGMLAYKAYEKRKDES